MELVPTEIQFGRPDAEGVAVFARIEPARTRQRGRHLHAAPQLSSRPAVSTPESGDGGHLAEHLDVPLRDRNALLEAAGYAAIVPRNGRSTRRR